MKYLRNLGKTSFGVLSINQMVSSYGFDWR
jgi:hypothetical protein